MGQRLNLEIWKNGEALANAYYHWSAYTDSALDIVGTALKYIKDYPTEFEHNDILRAIRILESTGAGLTYREVEYAKSFVGLIDATFAECKSRNHGLISISKGGIGETRYWSEGIACIYIDEERVSFDVFFKQQRWEWEKEQREDYGDEEADAENLGTVDMNLDDVKFYKWDNFKDFLHKREEPFICEIDINTVLTPIY